MMEGFSLGNLAALNELLKPQNNDSDSEDETKVYFLIYINFIFSKIFDGFI